jgi:hypothetical protein
MVTATRSAGIALEFDGVVHQTALGTTGEIDIGIIGVNVAASFAAIYAIFALARLKAASSEFGIDADSG